MTDNVFLFGAGFSRDAGIPLLGNFIESLVYLAAGRRTEPTSISPDQLQILRDAVDVLKQLDIYHGRANFDDRNIEDVLSILSFNALAGDRSAKTWLRKLDEAIASVIEIRCDVRHEGVPTNAREVQINTSGADVYREFWASLIEHRMSSREIPAIITLNYDLVLERSLLQTLIGTRFNGGKARLPFDGIQFDYGSGKITSEVFRIELCQWGDPFKPTNGTTLVRGGSPKRLEQIRLSKLHGSLNFPSSLTKSAITKISLSSPHPTPYIIAPIANKQNSRMHQHVWSDALSALRKARRLFVVGYSLPRTDIYMQSFLKAALGPNDQLDRIIVFDPVLGNDDEASRKMRKRYATCFASHLQSRIVFEPPEVAGFKRGSIDHGLYGSTSHFVRLLANHPDQLLF